MVPAQTATAPGHFHTTPRAAGGLPPRPRSHPDLGQAAPGLPPAGRSEPAPAAGIRQWGRLLTPRLQSVDTQEAPWEGRAAERGPWGLSRWGSAGGALTASAGAAAAAGTCRPAAAAPAPSAPGSP